MEIFQLYNIRILFLEQRKKLIYISLYQELTSFSMLDAGLNIPFSNLENTVNKTKFQAKKQATVRVFQNKFHSRKF
ncbi:hypothetical protein SAMN04515674_104205 [Pseudarcicella hirudinis]|uniref:Uncharacterized protein n=1 Tax=Pseudarcicella hirudinis TaxID=1079859 RepID=A0A1I5RRF1_9BACT|nr:hypothetical protein [Pseudarcicella hirudinis]SFP61088.1 hypothetical protein SAMN04515674_104205 [Pseudarcicella hirudinis]